MIQLLVMAVVCCAHCPRVKWKVNETGSLQSAQFVEDYLHSIICTALYKLKILYIMYMRPLEV